MINDSRCVICDGQSGAKTDVIYLWNKAYSCQFCRLNCSDGLDIGHKQMLISRGVPEDCIKFHKNDGDRGNIIVPSPFQLAY